MLNIPRGACSKNMLLTVPVADVRVFWSRSSSHNNCIYLQPFSASVASMQSHEPRSPLVGQSLWSGSYAICRSAHFCRHTLSCPAVCNDCELRTDRVQHRDLAATPPIPTHLVSSSSHFYQFISNFHVLQNISKYLLSST